LVLFVSCASHPRPRASAACKQAASRFFSAGSAPSEVREGKTKSREGDSKPDGRKAQIRRKGNPNRNPEFLRRTETFQGLTRAPTASFETRCCASLLRLRRGAPAQAAPVSFGLLPLLWSSFQVPPALKASEGLAPFLRPPTLGRVSVRPWRRREA
jgi:hypothetical protein